MFERVSIELLAVKPRLKCTKRGAQHADLQPDWSQTYARATRSLRQ
jgi:hypothetical protein